MKNIGLGPGFTFSIEIRRPLPLVSSDGAGDLEPPESSAFFLLMKAKKESRSKF